MPVYQLTAELVFPDPEWANPEGILAVGGDLQVKRLLLAYQQGIFPWYEEGYPLLWWSPPTRCILKPEEFHASRSLKRLIRQGRFRVTIDQAFFQVIHACAQTRLANGQGTWITQDMIDAYCDLHAAGFAHSVETWDGEQLAGGIYGVSLGRAFFGGIDVCAGRQCVESRLSQSDSEACGVGIQPARLPDHQSPFTALGSV